MNPPKSEPVTLPPITDEDRQFLHYNPNTDDLVEWVQNYARAAIAEQSDAVTKAALEVARCWDQYRWTKETSDAIEALCSALAQGGDANTQRGNDHAQDDPPKEP